MKMRRSAAIQTSCRFRDEKPIQNDRYELSGTLVIDAVREYNKQRETSVSMSSAESEECQYPDSLTSFQAPTHKALATSALLLDIRVVEDKLARNLVLLPIHLAPNYTKECLAVNEDLYAVLFDDLVELARFVDVFEMVGHPCATFVAHSDTNEFRCR